MTYKKIPLKNILKSNEQLKLILQLPFIHEALEIGGTIAGGFVRHLLNNGNLYNYLSIPDYSSVTQTKTHSGDIDIFFENVNQIKQVTSAREQYSYIDDLDLEPSLTNICVNITYGTTPMLGNKIHGRLKVQLVSDFYGDAEEIMETFDFTNSRCAIDSRFVYYDERFFDLEKNKLLDVRTGSGPLTGHRILKYLNKRGLEVITNESREAITEWSIRYGGKFWDDHPLAKVKGLSSSSTISTLIKDDRIFSTADLLNLIGTVQTRQPIYELGCSDMYSITGWNEGDLARDIIAKRAEA
jgi:hypothetical protein